MGTKSKIPSKEAQEVIEDEDGPMLEILVLELDCEMIT